MTSTTTLATETATALPIEIRVKYLANQHREPEVLSELYYERGLTLIGVGKTIGVTKGTVRKWMDRFGLPRRDGRFPRRPYATLAESEEGYHWWVVDDPDGTTTGVSVHQLTAIAAGADPYEVFSDGNLVHHRNGIPWDDRPENLEMLSAPEHWKTHAEAVWGFDGGLRCPVLKTAEGGDSDA